MKPDDTQVLLSKIRELEQKVKQLRVSRRVLLFLIERSEKEKELLVEQLQREKKILQSRNARFARWLFSHDKGLSLLEKEK
ncbi:MAG TPA: translation initiation factor 2 [Clostridia bacterium]|nr:translation initiation factor 2 [Clostridia bacterium]